MAMQKFLNINISLLFLLKNNNNLTVQLKLRKIKGKLFADRLTSTRKCNILSYIVRTMVQSQTAHLKECYLDTRSVFKTLILFLNY